MIRTILRKDLVSTWAGPVPFVVGATFQAVVGILMVNQLEVRSQAVIQPLFPVAGFLLLLVIPVLTMRTFAEEARAGTLDLLLAVPVPPGALVVAKWLSAWLTTLAVLVPSLVFGVLVELWGEPDRGPVVAGFVGLTLLAAAVTAIGVLASACTESQPIAAMTALFASVVVWFAHVGGDAVSTGGLLPAISFSERLRIFAVGRDRHRRRRVLRRGRPCDARVCLHRRRPPAQAMSPVRRRLVFTVLVLVVMIGLVRVADDRRRLFDLTDGDTLTLSSQTEDVVRALDDEVRITVFVRRSEPGRVEAISILDRYRRLSGRIDVDVIDPDGAPGEVARLGVDPLVGGVVVEMGDRRETVPFATEGDLTGALARLLRDGTDTVCATTGHGERGTNDTDLSGLSDLRGLVERDGYRVVDIDLLAAASIPDDCTAVLVAAPTAPFGDAAEVELARWVDADGRLLLLTDPLSEQTPGAATLAELGLTVERGVVFEGDAANVVAGDVSAPIVDRYPSASPVVRGLPPTFFPLVQEIAVDDGATGDGLTAGTLAETTEASYLERNPVTADFDPDDDRPGPITVVAAADRSRLVGTDVRRTRVVVTGDVDFASNNSIREAGNAQLIRQAIAWLTETEDLVAVSPNLPRDRPLRLTDARTTYARVLTMGVVPGLFLLAGAMVWAMRRNR